MELLLLVRGQLFPAVIKGAVFTIKVTLQASQYRCQRLLSPVPRVTSCHGCRVRSLLARGHTGCAPNCLGTAWRRVPPRPAYLLHAGKGGQVCAAPPRARTRLPGKGVPRVHSSATFTLLRLIPTLLRQVLQLRAPATQALAMRTCRGGLVSSAFHPSGANSSPSEAGANPTAPGRNLQFLRHLGQVYSRVISLSALNQYVIHVSGLEPMVHGARWEGLS